MLQVGVGGRGDQGGAGDGEADRGAGQDAGGERNDSHTGLADSMAYHVLTALRLIDHLARVTVCLSGPRAPAGSHQVLLPSLHHEHTANHLSCASDDVGRTGSWRRRRPRCCGPRATGGAWCASSATSSRSTSERSCRSVSRPATCPNDTSTHTHIHAGICDGATGESGPGHHRQWQPWALGAV